METNCNVIYMALFGIFVGCVALCAVNLLCLLMSCDTNLEYTKIPFYLFVRQYKFAPDKWKLHNTTVVYIDSLCCSKHFRFSIPFGVVLYKLFKAHEDRREAKENNKRIIQDLMDKDWKQDKIEFEKENGK